MKIKYSVPVELLMDGQFIVEAESEEEALEIAKNNNVYLKISSECTNDDKRILSHSFDSGTQYIEVTGDPEIYS